MFDQYVATTKLDKNANTRQNKDSDESYDKDYDDYNDDYDDNEVIKGERDVRMCVVCFVDFR